MTAVRLFDLILRTRWLNESAVERRVDARTVQYQAFRGARGEISTGHANAYMCGPNYVVTTSVAIL